MAIVTRTPLRITFVGGGSDLPAFYEKHTGACVNCTIDKYIYIVVNKRHDDKIMLHYSQTEFVNQVSEIKNEYIRACLERMDIKGGIEITSMADVPSEGSGLGSSSAYLVGLLNALAWYKHHVLGIYPDVPLDLAEEAFWVESAMLGKSCGKQDHYAAAYGGLNYFEFKSSGVKVERLGNLDWLDERVLMFDTGMTRSSEGLLQELTANIMSGALMETLKFQVGRADEVGLKHIPFREFEFICDSIRDAWSAKRRLYARDVADDDIDAWIDLGLLAGAGAGKLMGAGAGGYILFLCEPDFHQAVKDAVPLKNLPIRLTSQPSKVVYYD